MTKQNVLVVDDQPNIRKLVSYNVEKMGYETDTANDGYHCIEMMKMSKYAAVLLDIQMPDKGGIETLKEIKRDFPDVSVIMVTALSDVTLAVQAVKLGAFEYITKPVDFDRLETELRNAIEQHSLKKVVSNLKQELNNSQLFTNMIGQSKAMSDVFNLTDRVLNSDASVLIIGESGSGKELLAQAIHEGSSRIKGPFVPVNSAAITRELADSLLFGHKKGSFTGATDDRMGYFEQADGGTIFLDEIGDMQTDIQAKVLRVLEEKAVRRVGEKKEREVNFRVIAATNRDLALSIKEGNFRKDLYYRLEEYPIFLPPLRERQDDVILLAQSFLDEYCESNAIKRMTFDDRILDQFREHHWPGNIRELKNVVRRAAIREQTETITEITFSNIDSDQSQLQNSIMKPAEGQKNVLPFETVERQAIENAFSSTNHNVVKAARLLGISRATMYRKLKQYELES